MRESIVVAGLLFGDEGKGSIVDHLCRTMPVHTVIRYNGGSQAAHSVVTSEPDRIVWRRQHTFAQFGSGTLVEGVRTHWSKFCYLNPSNLLAEGHGLAAIDVKDAFARLTIHENAPIITPYHVAANRLREISRGNDRHGSCCQGVGETVVDYAENEPLLARDLLDSPELRRKLRAIHSRIGDQVSDLLHLDPDLSFPWTDDPMTEEIASEYAHVGRLSRIVDDHYVEKILDDGLVVFEGAQGVLLDQWYGFYPNTTWSRTGFDNTDVLLPNGYDGEVTRLGVVRAYMTRHGAGPLPTEDDMLTRELVDPNNPRNDWQGGLRVGYTDLVLLDYARRVVGHVDALAVTCLDHIVGRPNWLTASQYDDGDFIPVMDLCPQREMIEHQQQITDRLYRAEPRYEESSLETAKGVIDFLAKIGSTVQAPVTIASYGPTSSDKLTHIRDRGSFSQQRLRGLRVAHSPVPVPIQHSEM